MSRMMGLLPMPIEGMYEFQQQELERINQLPPAQRYDAMANLSRNNDLIQSINDGYSTPETRAELEHRITTDPSWARLIEAGRLELAHRQSPYDDESPAMLRDTANAVIDFMLTADIETLAKLDVADMHLHGLKARAEEHGDLSASETEFVAQMDSMKLIQYMNNPAAEIGDMLLNPASASVDASDMKAGFESLAGVVNTFLSHSEILNEAAQNVGGAASALNAASARSIMNNGFTDAANGQSGDVLPETNSAANPNVLAPTGM